jgi:hypothetical protein
MGQTDEGHRLQLTYDGMLAGKGAMDPSDAHNVIEGAKRFLSAHCNYYVSGHVPDKVYANGDQFRILFLGTRKGSLIYDLAVNVGGSFIYDVLKFSFELFLLHSFLSWREGKMIDVPEIVRAQPELSDGKANFAVFDFAEDRKVQRERLAARLTQAMEQITMPIGRSATRVAITFDGKLIGTWERRLRQWSEDDITAAVRSLRRQGPSLRTL